MAEAQILVAKQEGCVQIRVLGRATFKISQDLRDFGAGVLQENVSSIIVDLSECQGMDSTFLGVLAMIGLQGRDTAGLVIVNADEAHRGLLESIGLSRIWTFAEKPVRNVTWRSLCEAAVGAVDMKSVGETVLAAHRTLMDLAPENVPKFRDVVALLASEMESSDADDGADAEQGE